MAAAAILKNREIAISAVIRPISTKFGMATEFDPLDRSAIFAAEIWRFF